MKILLLGDYSNVHATLADALRRLGHEVVLASDGDGWKNYPRDVDLARPKGFCANLRYLIRLLRVFRRFKGFDVVQLINPVFLPLKAERIRPFYNYLRRHNKKLFLGAFGMDYYYVNACVRHKIFRYSDFNLYDTLRDTKETRAWLKDWYEGEKGRLNQLIAKEADGIIAGLQEYYAAYATEAFPRFTYIPFPIRPQEDRPLQQPQKIRFFIGIQRERHAYKGTDIMLAALERVVADFPTRCEMVKVESVPFDAYVELMNSSHVILDQLYSYTPAMNALEAMARGLIVVGGAEKEFYALHNEQELQPVVNVLPDEDDVYAQLKALVCHPERIPLLASQSQAFIRKHHDFMQVAERYIAFWQATDTH